ncbi:trypsin-like peptidase domain-containing protein [Paenarthrobacter sp. Z7-10]|uniref:S1C family serine protease n=1 Tax=Paenarthrobacter sp. Z7-10 TaxID=2787635 RepID=UPI0022A90EEB|nr:trypsin-like peptidase domain-containing protein [Paenarthrobacter sp. Z7-10]MCZ2404869.1 trypsin-like peptidase domain-containing protein [Paenarthrobacter sp. Z7-10]
MKSFRIGAAVGVTAATLALTGCTGNAPAATSSSAVAATVSSSANPASSAAAAPATLPEGAGLPAVPGVVKEVEPSVVTIRTAIGLGSGVVYRSDGTIVTDAHVVEDQQKQPFKNVQVQFADGSQSPAVVVGVDDVTDVAVIKADRTGLPAAKFSTTTPEVGSLAVVIGTPLGLAETVTAGIVSSLHRNMPPSKESPHGAINLLQTDAPISPGNSGGAVTNSSGEIIGLSEAYLPPSSGAVSIGFVTPTSTVTDVADQLLKSGTVKHAALGIVPTDITPQIAQRFSLPATTGALVVSVSQGGPAATAGMQAGDIISKFAGTKVGNVTDLLAALRKQDPGQETDVVVQRGKATQTLHVTLGDLANQH